MPTLWRIFLASSVEALISTPFTVTVPVVGCNKPFKCCTKVDLPEPV